MGPFKFSLGYASAIRACCAAWSIVLVVLMAFGAFSSARIGTMTWGPSHDIWSAAIAISQMKFGLKGGLAYKEVELAIAADTTSKGNAWEIFDDETRARLKDPAAITRGFKRAIALTKEQVSISANKGGYTVDWCEDLGYADFYNLAFRIFGLNAYSTHYLFVAMLLLTVLLFQNRYIHDTPAMATLTLSVTAIFLVSVCPIFDESTPSFAANRFLSVLGLIPLLHLLHAALRRGPFAAFELAIIAFQALVLAFVVSVRGSGSWCLVALGASLLGLWLFRLRPWSLAQLTPSGFKAAWRTPERHLPRTAMTALIAFAVIAVFGWVRNAQFDDRYRAEDNMPHHLLWHSAYLGLTVNPEWHNAKPYPEVPDGGDGAGLLVFEHLMKERGEPATSPAGWYRARLYEKMIRREYFSFLAAHPKYAFDLFFYYKPKALIDILARAIGSIQRAPMALALVSLALVLALFAASARARAANYIELGGSCVLIWLSSMLPSFWAYPAGHVIADPLLGNLFMALVLLSAAGMLAIAIGFRTAGPGAEGSSTTNPVVS